MRSFVAQVYVPDVLLVASAYPDWTEIGGDTRNFMTYGGYGSGSVNDTATYLFPRGIIIDLDLSTSCRWTRRRSPSRSRAPGTATRGRDAALHPYQGETDANYTGPTPPYQWLETDGKYSWLKAPRYDGPVIEVGPLARVLVAYAAGVPAVTRTVDAR